MTPLILTARGAGLWRQSLFDGARHNLERDGELSPVAFFVARRHPETGEVADQPGIVPMLALGTFCERVKQSYAEAVVALAVGLDAAGAAFIAEAWDVHGTPEETSAALRWREAHGTLASFPGRRECVHVTFEHIAVGLEHWRAAITRDDDGTPRLGEWRRLPYGEAHGRFAHLLSPSAYGPGGAEA